MGRRRGLAWHFRAAGSASSCAVVAYGITFHPSKPVVGGSNSCERATLKTAGFQPKRFSSLHPPCSKPTLNEHPCARLDSETSPAHFLRIGPRILSAESAGSAY
jgi:hypothetical protein